MKPQRKLLVPSVNFDDLKGIRKLSKYFMEAELDLYGLKTNLPQAELVRLNAAKAALEGAGMRAHAVHLRGFDLSTSSRAAKLDAMVKYCNEICGLFGPEVAVLHPGRGDMDTLVESLGIILPRIPESMTIAMENMTGGAHVLHSPETIRQFISRAASLPKNVGVCIDTTHPGFPWGTMDSESYTSLVLEYIEAALPKLRHLHFSDRLDASDNSKHLPLGDGIVDWKRMDLALRKAGYGGRAAIEIRFTEDVAEKTIQSACMYYGCGQTDLKAGGGSDGMADTAASSEFLAKLEKLPNYVPMPPPVSTMLKLPKNAIVDQSEEHLYFIVPSDSYKKGHVDPFDVLYGEALDRFDWAEYVFGVRYHGSHLSAVLIDKERRVAVCDTIYTMLPMEKMRWDRFEAALKKALEYAKTESPNPKMKTDHVMVTPYGGVQFIYVMDELAWGRDY